MRRSGSLDEGGELLIVWGRALRNGKSEMRVSGASAPDSDTCFACMHIIKSQAENNMKSTDVLILRPLRKDQCLKCYGGYGLPTFPVKWARQTSIL